MMSYGQAAMKLGTKDSAKVANNTYLVRIDFNTIAVRHQNTHVVLIRRNGMYTLNSGGWRTLTTKDRINAYSPARLFQKAREWYLQTPNSVVPYRDNMVVNDKGDVVK